MVELYIALLTPHLPSGRNHQPEMELNCPIKHLSIVDKKNAKLDSLYPYLESMKEVLFSKGVLLQSKVVFVILLLKWQENLSND